MKHVYLFEATTMDLPEFHIAGVALALDGVKDVVRGEEVGGAHLIKEVGQGDQGQAHLGFG